MWTLFPQLGALPSPVTHTDVPVHTETDVPQLLPAPNTRVMNDSLLPAQVTCRRSAAWSKPWSKKAKYAFIVSPNGHRIVPQVTESNKNLISENGSIALSQYNILKTKTELQISSKVCLHLPWFCTGWKLSGQGVEHHIHANKSSQGRILLMFTQLPAGSEHRQTFFFPNSNRY